MEDMKYQEHVYGMGESHCLSSCVNFPLLNPNHALPFKENETNKKRAFNCRGLGLFLNSKQRVWFSPDVQIP